MIIYETFIDSYGDILFHEYFANKEKMLKYHKEVEQYCQHGKKMFWQTKEIEVQE